MKYLVNIIAILVVVFLVFSLIQFKNETANPLTVHLRRAWGNALQFLKVQKHNLSTELAPARQRPLTYIEKEAKIRLFAPDIFSKFEDKDWEEFWNIIYGSIKEKEGKLRVARYRTRQEIEDALIDKFPNTFEHFRSEDWQTFWLDCVGIIWTKEDTQTGK